MADNFTDVGRFHARFGLPSNTWSGGSPRVVPSDLLEFRERFLEEELEEFKEGVKAGDVEKMFDSLLDIVYVAMGTAHLFGFPWQEGWDEVQRANMTKVRAETDQDSERGGLWDVVKPPGWTPPAIDEILHESGFKDFRCPRCGEYSDDCTVDTIAVMDHDDRIISRAYIPDCVKDRA